METRVGAAGGTVFPRSAAAVKSMNRRVATKLAGVVCGLLLVATSAVAADAKPAAERSVTHEYSSPVVGVAWPTYTMQDCGVFVLPLNQYLVQGCSIPRIRANERYVSVAAEDATRLPVALKVFQWAAGAGGPPRYIGKDACSNMPPWKLRPWATYMWIEVLAGPCHDGTPAFATQGTVTTTFYTNKPSG